MPQEMDQPYRAGILTNAGGTMAPVNEEGGTPRPHQHLGSRFLCATVAVGLCPLLAHVDFGTRDGTVLAAVYAQQVDRRRDIPKGEQRAYAELLAKNLAAEDLHEAQYVVIVDRNPSVQAAMIYWMSTDREFHFIYATRLHRQTRKVRPLPHSDWGFRAHD